ncbi:MAG TPA: hypothetical protein VNT99_10785 [Methylomirabilota bacterium]|nr:hypothetical protein [Methylomirabilota bacterium]
MPWCAALAVLTCSGRADDFQGATHMMPFEEDTINYNNATPTGAVPQLQKRIDAGASTLEYGDAYGYLLALLDELKIPKSSQMLVFSKTSLQREHISPSTPRSIFFNDDIYVGFIPGAPLIELSFADPKLGGVFYTIDQSEAGKARIVRNNQCLECHATAKTMGVPGHLARSFATDDHGVVDFNSGISQVNHRTPFEERWGGWYVTGTHGKQTHRGNLVGKAAFERQTKEPNHAGNVTNLSGYFDVSRYLRNRSDVVALLVLEHQMHMHNFITRLNYETTMQLKQYGHVRYLKNTAESFLKYLLFAEEARLTDPVEGSAEFAKDFAARGPRDKRGRSLRDFDLQTRLFKFPCSYLIYSDAFNALPAPMKEQLYARLWEILTGKDQSATYASLSPPTRQAIREILTETKRDLPDYWRKKQPTPVSASTRTLGRSD